MSVPVRGREAEKGVEYGALEGRCSPAVADAKGNGA